MHGAQKSWRASQIANLKDMTPVAGKDSEAEMSERFCVGIFECYDFHDRHT